jgi:membrane protease YdiL (CAAX protease family)
MQSMNSYTLERQSTSPPTRRRAAPEVYLFGGLAILLSFATYLLPLPRTMLPYLIVLLPTLLALCFTAYRTGRAGVATLLGQIGGGDFDARWLAVAILMALGLRVTMSVVALGMGLIDTIQVRAATPFEMLSFAVMLFFAALLEEVGWRGFALPKLLATRRALAAALIIGIMWGLVHLALLLPGMVHAGTSPLATLIYLVSLSVLLTWLYVNSGGSVLLVTIFHASQSFFVIVNEGITQAQQVWLMAVVGLIMALIVVVISGPRLLADSTRLARWRT